MKINPRLDLFKIRLRRTDSTKSTFHDFAKALAGSETSVDDFNKTLFDHFIKMLSTEKAKSKSTQKMVCLVDNGTKNMYINYRPSFDSRMDLIYGVINGGIYGRNGLISNLEDATDVDNFGANKTVLSYYYIFLYLPKNHDVGLAMIHSNRYEDNISGVFKDYLKKIFKTKGYYYAGLEPYCPKLFQDNFRDAATIQKVSFTQEILENTHSKDPIIQQLMDYDIQIIASPRDKNVPFKNIGKFRKLISEKIFKINRSQERKLDGFSKSEVTLKDQKNSGQKTFQWNSRYNDFIPVIYLDDVIKKKNIDGSPDFDELKKYCLYLFKNEVLPELRPDLYAKRT